MNNIDSKKKKSAKEIATTVGKKAKQTTEDYYVNGQAVDFLAKQTGNLLATMFHDPLFLAKDEIKQLVLYCDARYKNHNDKLLGALDMNRTEINITQRLDELKDVTTAYEDIVDDIEKFIERNKEVPEYQELIHKISDDTGRLKENLKLQIQRLETSKEQILRQDFEVETEIEEIAEEIEID